MREKNLLPTIIICCGAGLFFLLLEIFFIPVKSEILQMQAEIKKLQAVKKELEILQERHENFSEFVELNGIRLQDLQMLLPSTPSQEKFAATLYKIAEKNKLAVTSLQVGESTEVDDNLQKQSVRIKLEGHYVSILNFLREVVDGERFVKLEKIFLEVESGNLILCDVEFFIFNRH